MNMFGCIVFLVLTFIHQTDTSSIPYISSVFLQSSTYNHSNTLILGNVSFDECLCESLFPNSSVRYFALNYFPNGTCQFFPSFPRSYKLVETSGARLYFLQNEFPNASQCCMSNITELISRLKTTTPTTMNLTFQPAGFGYDELNPQEAVVSGWSMGVLYFFNPFNLTLLRNFSINEKLTVALHNNLTYTALDGVPIINIRDSLTNNHLGNFTASTLDQVRKLQFLNNGSMLAIPTQNNQSVSMFSVNSSIVYSYLEGLPCSLSNAHGIAKVNDSFFYVSSWTDRSIASYSYQNSSWAYKPFVNRAATPDGSHVLVDECERVWFVNTQFGLRIYDSSGTEVANWNMSLSSTNQIYDILFLSNYVLLVSFIDGQKIVQYDPQVTCT